MMQHARSPSQFPARGFALVVVMSLMVLLTIAIVGLLSLSSVALRSSAQSTAVACAQANARLALMLALGDLQRYAGPDTRATAPASILGSADIAHPNWTGVWSTRAPTGGPLLTRDDKAGGLTDTRSAESDREHLALGWLVSGATPGSLPSPRQALTENPVKLVGPGTVGSDAATNEVSAPRVAITPGTGQGGHYAWWVGDLGVKANVATPDAFESKTPDPNTPAGGGWFRMMTSQEADASTLADPATLDASKKRRLISENTPKLLNPRAHISTGKHFHDFTTHSKGLLADMSNGGLKRDLTPYFQSTGRVPDRNGLAGLSDEDRLVGPANATDPIAARDGITWADTRHQFTSPRFGLLRRWATAGAPFKNSSLAAIPPKPEPAPRASASKDKELALTNLTPASIAAADTPSLFPILVEGSIFFNMSWHVGAPDQTTPTTPNQWRNHLYPRVVLWNPYNTKLILEPAMVMIQGNGRQEMWVDAYKMLGAFRLNYKMAWLWTEGGRSNNFSAPGSGSVLDSEGYTDPYIGSWYFALPRTTFGPGETLVFSPAESREYSGAYVGTKAYALESNVLSCENPPHQSRSFYVSNTDIGSGFDYIPVSYYFAPIGGAYDIKNQTDDCRVVLKQLGARTNLTFEQFDALPQIALLSASLQYGSGREPRVSWNKLDPVPIEGTENANPILHLPPDVRTREGIRLRWFDEHFSNTEGSGSLKGTAHFEDALIANWNPRAAYVTRSPFENIAGSMPASGTLGGPWFFGAYTRDLYDGAVSWGDQTPVPRDGRQHGNPFGPPQELGGKPIVLFDIPREGTGVLSIGQFQHAKLSEFIWHPSYAVGQSLADPRLATGPLSGLDHTAPLDPTSAGSNMGGFDASDIGWSGDAQRSNNRDAWAFQARAIFQDYPATDNLVYDLSFELNQTLWDPFFLSTGSTTDKQQFLADPKRPPLPNGRMCLAPVTGATATAADLTDFHRAAYALSVDGAFNVNSTSTEAWKAVLGATRRLSADGKSIVFPRVLSPPGGEWTAADSAEAGAAWSGKRVLSADEIDSLATAIVAQVRKRGPFLSLADFVNRRLANDETGRMGALQAAIEAAHLNARFQAEYPLDNSRPLPDYKHPDNIRDATRFEQTLKPDCKAWGIPGYLTQGDLLQVLGPMLTARSDTFVIRAYGDATDANGKVQARAWCEAVVQRCPEPIAPDASGLNSGNFGKATDMGRRFVMKSFRWLRPEEV